MDHHLEERLRQLGKATEAPESLVGGVMQRIEESAGWGKSGRHGIPWGRSGHRRAAIVAVAACIAGLAIATPVLRNPAPRHAVLVHPWSGPLEPANLSPTLAEYQHAMVQSPEALDALLQQRPAQDVHGAPVGAELKAADVFRSDLTLYE